MRPPGCFNDRRGVKDVPFCKLKAYTTAFACLNLLQGGRLVTERRMVSDLYVFDLETFVWEMIPYTPGDDIPQPRYFHSADACRPGLNSTLSLYSSDDLQGTITLLYSVE